MIDTMQEQTQELIDVLDSDAPHKERVDACRRLARVGSKQAVPVLAGLLDDEKLAHMARYALEPIDDEAVDEALREALGSLKGLRLIGAIGSIGVRRDAKAVGPLAKMLQGADVGLAKAAARTLGKIGTPEATELLGRTLGDAPAEIRSVAADACLACAESLLADGKTAEAAAVYRSVAKAELPKHFGFAAAHGMIRAR